MKPTAATRLAGQHPLRWFTSSPEEGEPDCLCSLCETPIPATTGEMDFTEDGEEFEKSTVAVRMWTQGEPCLEARFHDECFEAVQRAGIMTMNHLGTSSGHGFYTPIPTQTVEVPNDPFPDLGKCCYCEGTAGVRNIITVHFRSPDGKGWGCLECGLPMAGATAVLCDGCLEAKRRPRFAVLGYPSENRRVPIEQLTEPFDHDMSKHQGGY